jgi:uncharacterized protein (TIGR00725 family)
MHVAVIGPGDDATEADLRDAYETGRLLAAHGCTVITGGLGGVMAEACRGCHDAAGTAVGVLPGDEPGDGNPYLTLALPTGLGELRNALVVRAAEGVIAVGGSWGTLSELALAMRTGKPAVSLHGWRITDAAGAPVPVVTARTAAGAVSALLDRLGLGSVIGMTEFPDEERVETRGQHLLPEEQSAGGSDDPEQQAEVILEDSEERTEHPEETKRRSTQTPD